MKKLLLLLLLPVTALAVDKIIIYQEDQSAAPTSISPSDLTVGNASDLACTNCIGSTEIDGASLEAEIEAVVDLSDLQGAETDPKVGTLINTKWCTTDGTVVNCTTNAPAGSEAFPVGAVFISVVSTNPNTLLGYGTWAAFATGRVLVGIDAGQTEFDVVEETGGAKTHTLTEAEMPSHTHTQNAHNHQTLRERSATTGGATTQIARTGDTSSTVDTNIFTENATPTNQNTGGGGAHNNLQPYIVVYIWERTL